MSSVHFRMGRWLRPCAKWYKFCGSSEWLLAVLKRSAAVGPGLCCHATVLSASMFLCVSRGGGCRVRIFQGMSIRLVVYVLVVSPSSTVKSGRVLCNAFDSGELKPICLLPHFQLEVPR